MTSDGFEYNQITVGTKIAKYMKSSSRLKKFKKYTNQHKLPNAATNKTPQTNETKKLHAHTTQVAECGKLQNTTDIYTL